jgi:ABC-type branched-subunit amino acid transport system substrate-binding protein
MRLASATNDSADEEMMLAPMRFFLVVLAVSLVVASGAVLAEKRYGPGVTDTEIKIGQTMPYSGPLSAYGTIGRAEAAYFAKINAEGGINGRKVKLISLDDGYNPARTVEQTRKLIEQEDVLLLFSPLGTPTNTAIHKYVNAKKVPHLVLATGATKWGDPQNFPWTMGWQLPYRVEAKIYATYILQNRPDGKIGVLYQNDDYGKDLLNGLKDGLGGKAARMIIGEASYEPSDPTVDSQIVALRASGADVFVNFSTPKAAAQAIRRVYDLGWQPLHIINKVASSVGVVLTPAGLKKSVGIVSLTSQKDPTDPRWRSDPGMNEWFEWMHKYYPDGDTTDDNNVYGYNYAQTLGRILEQCGDDLTRENVVRQAANLRNVELPLLLPGIKINTGPGDYFPIEQAQMMRFDGKEWVRFGELIGN